MEVYDYGFYNFLNETFDGVTPYAWSIICNIIEYGLENCRSESEYFNLLTGLLPELEADEIKSFRVELTRGKFD